MVPSPGRSFLLREESTTISAAARSATSRVPGQRTVAVGTYTLTDNPTILPWWTRTGTSSKNGRPQTADTTTAEPRPVGPALRERLVTSLRVAVTRRCRLVPTAAWTPNAMTSITTRPTARYRPVSVPDDVDDPSIVKACGRVVLPLHVRWSGHKVYDLDNLQHRKLVYEQVLAEGLDEDVRRFVEVDELVALCD